MNPGAKTGDKGDGKEYHWKRMLGSEGAPPREEGDDDLVLLSSDPPEHVGGKAKEDQGARDKDNRHDYGETVMTLESEVRVDGEEEMDKVRVCLPAEPSFCLRESERRSISARCGTLLASATLFLMWCCLVTGNNRGVVIKVFLVNCHQFAGIFIEDVEGRIAVGDLTLEVGHFVAVTLFSTPMSTKEGHD